MHFGALITYSFLLLLWASNANALPNDAEQPIHIKADSAERDEKSAQTIYIGNVTITQGSLQIAADKVVIDGTAGNIASIQAIGKPAHLQQRPNAQQPAVHARGNNIYYHLDKKLVQLLGDASLIQQGGSTVSGERIDYFIAEQVIRAHSSNSATEQVEVIIPAPQKPKNPGHAVLEPGSSNP